MRPSGTGSPPYATADQISSERTVVRARQPLTGRSPPRPSRPGPVT
jgi:hypothetical protein